MVVTLRPFLFSSSLVQPELSYRPAFGIDESVQGYFLVVGHAEAVGVGVVAAVGAHGPFHFRLAACKREDPEAVTGLEGEVWTLLFDEPQG